MDMRGHKTKGMTRRGQTQEQKRNLTDESELKMIIGQNRAKWTEKTEYDETVSDVQ